MAVEDHPRYPEWREKLEKYLELAEAYKSAIARRESPGILRTIRGNLELAQRQFWAVADAIDYA